MDRLIYVIWLYTENFTPFKKLHIVYALNDHDFCAIFISHVYSFFSLSQFYNKQTKKGSTHTHTHIFHTIIMNDLSINFRFSSNHNFVRFYVMWNLSILFYFIFISCVSCVFMLRASISFPWTIWILWTNNKQNLTNVFNMGNYINILTILLDWYGNWRHKHCVLCNVYVIVCLVTNGNSISIDKTKTVVSMNRLHSGSGYVLLLINLFLHVYVPMNTICVMMCR